MGADAATKNFLLYLLRRVAMRVFISLSDDIAADKMKRTFSSSQKYITDQLFLDLGNLGRVLEGGSWYL
ncbi:hypothetical protein FG476_03825 [Xylella fastidiosa subsp. multiplex]|uniref:Uncharacterized protein n=1 Tax=Xylella fastidiosa subsp. multiplex TaxID=644357 RepID=A0A9Q4MIW6_XYLFS|nr:hypothetical protein [Xylella fastidiosa]MBE0268943.1 hypothetical protein [Xylella fastidiosa subsp. multiplex]MBE0275662.1 hypothetical protein [Xylella fastidiosa subsp. multiplex]MBE0277829.1 hypothetical protein [Xylella fastidiosa subsp. multiplex]MBE0282082.1 hypothetical protein [Xylella fastidiosa subsp. multiplex]MDD0899888.1 hypothetical protein [Xylella fastidiosa subsp. multiplex]